MKNLDPCIVFGCWLTEGPSTKQWASVQMTFNHGLRLSPWPISLKALINWSTKRLLNRWLTTVFSLKKKIDITKISDKLYLQQTKRNKATHALILKREQLWNSPSHKKSPQQKRARNLKLSITLQVYISKT